MSKTPQHCLQLGSICYIYPRWSCHTHPKQNVYTSNTKPADPTTASTNDMINMPPPLTEDGKDTLRLMQRRKPFCNCMSKRLLSGKAPSHKVDTFTHIKGLIYKPVMDSNRRFLPLVISKSWHFSLLIEAHVKLGHQGVNRNYHLIKYQYNWKDMNKDIHKYINNCALFCVDFSFCCIIKQLVDSLEQNIDCWRQAFIQPTAGLHQVWERTEMLHLIWVLRGSISILRTCKNCTGKLGWPKCVGKLGWFKWVGILGWLELTCPTACTCLFKLRPGVLCKILSHFWG